MKTEKSLEDSGVSIDGLTETVKHKKTQESRFLGALLVPLAASLLQPVISLLVKGMSRRGVRKVERDIWMKTFSSALSFKQYQD